MGIELDHLMVPLLHGEVDNQVGSYNGGSIVYWNQPDGHAWEMLTVSYAREPQA